MVQLSKPIFLFVLVVVYFCAWAGAAEIQLETPEQLLEVFYDGLLSDKPLTELPQIFAEPTTFASALKWPNQDGVSDKRTATMAVWEYFRANKKALLFAGIDPSQTVKKCSLGYSFVTFSNSATFFDGIFCVELMAPLTKSGKEGVYKQIRFPLLKNSGMTSPRYLVQESMITINGVIFGPSGDFTRTGNLYDQLGIKAKECPQERQSQP